MLLCKTGSERRSAVVEIAEIAEIPVEEPELPPQWERAECTCPEWCERDHEQD
jgi:hypothetical protein